MSLSGLCQYAKKRDALLDRIRTLLEEDRRVSAVWLSGSFGRGEADEWSDLDLHIAVADAHVADILAGRDELYRSVGEPILIQQDMPSDSQAGARFQLVLYRGPIEVDWNIGPQSQAKRPLAFKTLVERSAIPIVEHAPLSAAERQAEANHWLTFFWAMMPIAIKFCGRRDTRRAVKQIDLLMTAFIALWRLVSQPDGSRPILPATNRVLEPELDARIPRLAPVITPRGALDVIDELRDRVQELHPALHALGAVIGPDVQAEVTTLRAIADEALLAGDFATRKYR